MLQIYEREDIEALKSAMPQFADRFCGNSEVRSVDRSLAPPPPPEEIAWIPNLQIEGEAMPIYSAWTKSSESRKGPNRLHGAHPARLAFDGCCPNCNSVDTYSGGTDRGVRRRKCRGCGKSWRIREAG